LLRGLAIRLGVEHSYLETMAPIAREVLREEARKKEEKEAVAAEKFNPPPRISDTKNQIQIIQPTSKFNNAVQEMISNGLLLGAGVCAI